MIVSIVVLLRSSLDHAAFTMTRSRPGMAESAKVRSDLVEEIKRKCEEFGAGKQHANNIIDVLTYLEEEEGVTLQCLQALQKMCLQMIKVGAVRTTNKDGKAKQEFIKWIRERYTETFERISLLLGHTEPRVQEKAMGVLLRLIVEEAKSRRKKQTGCRCSLERWCLIVSQLMSDDNKQPLIRQMQEYTKYDDVKRCVLKAVQSCLQEKGDNHTEEFMLNVLLLLGQVCTEHTVEKPSSKLICLPQGSDNSVDLKAKFGSGTMMIRDIWPAIVRWSLTPKVSKTLLVLVPDKIMPHLEAPLLLADFFIDTYNMGGASSVLALQGVFVLMQKYNLEYPDFYTKLYSLLEPRVLHTKYRSRFFHLVDIFLSSTHLPEYVAASFAKRMSRLCLQSPPEAIFLLLRFIGNLLLRHSGLLCLIDRKGATNSDMTSDPFLAEEPNPSRTHAMESSLWEIQSLQSHLIPEVASAAKFIKQPMPKVEWDINELLDLTAEEMMKEEIGRSIAECPINHKRPKAMEMDYWTY